MNRPDQMTDLYDAIGKLAAAAHANGDEIDENVFPDDPGNDRHGLDISSNGQYIRLRDVPNEPRFDIESPFAFSPRLQNRYTPEELSERADVDFPSLSEDRQEAVIESVLRADLEAAQEHEADFEAAFQEELDPVDMEVLRLTYGDENLWNGIVVRDRLFPYEESFGTAEYRRVVRRVRSLAIDVGQLLVETVPPLNGDHDQSKRTEAIIGFQ